MPVEHFDNTGKVHKRARETVNLVDHHHIDPPYRDVLQKALECGSLHGTHGETTIIIMLGNDFPTETDLGGNIGGTCLPLGIERVESLLKTFLGRLPSIDGTAK